MLVFDGTQLSAAGYTSLAEFARNLPQNADTMNEAALGSTGARGTAQFNLRGAGVDATLTLLNGRRIAPYGASLFGTDYFVDLNAIPVHLVERIEVLTDGASAIYGSEAVAGVVNVMLKERTDGIQLDGGYLRTTHGDAEERQLDASGGFAHERGSVSVALSYLEREPLYARDRDWSSDLDFSNRGGPNARSPLSSPATFLLLDTGTYAADPACPAQGPLANRDLLVPGEVELCRFNWAHFASQNSPAERVSAFVASRFEASANTQLFGEYFYAKNENDSVLAPTTIEAAVDADHPSNPFSEDVFAYYRALDVGLRRYRNDGDTSRWVVGASGRAREWQWETAVNVSRSRVEETNFNAVRTSLFQEAVLGRGGTFGDSYYNPFGWNPQNDADVIDGFRVPETWNRSVTEETSFDALLRRPVASIRDNDVNVAFGIQWRRQSLDESLDAVQASGDLAGVGLPATPLDEHRDVRSAFAEVLLPLNDRIEVQLAARTDDYSDFGTTTNPKVALGWKITEAWSAHTSWGTSFRPPAFRELLDPVTNEVATTGEDVWRCPATQDAIDCFGQPVPLTRRGNAQLDPERGETTQVGFVWQPASVPGSSIGVDAWRINYSNRIVRVADRFDLLFAQLPPDANPYVLREDPTATDALLGIPGRVSGLIDTYINADQLDTRGVDVDFGLTIPATRFGEVTTRLMYTYLHSYDLGLDDAGARDSTDLAGGYGFFGPLPRHRANWSAQWSRAPHAISAELHYTGEYRSKTDTWRNNVDTGLPFDVNDWWALDLQYQYRLMVLKDATLRIGCRNCTDEAPPRYNDTTTGENIHDGRGTLLYVRWTQPL